MFFVRKTQCESCIFKKDSLLNLKSLLDQVRDKKLEGHFKGYRMCHTPRRTSGLCCRGFWDRFKDRFDLGQLAQRLGLVTFTDEPQKIHRPDKKHECQHFDIDEDDICKFCNEHVCRDDLFELT